MSVLGRAARRYLLRHPWQMALATLGVAVGVAVVVAIGVASGSAQRAFDLSTETVVGRTTHHLFGGPTGLPDALFRDLRLAGVRPSAPVVEGYVALPGPEGRTLHVLGLDPFSEAPFRSWFAGAAPGRAAGEPLPLAALLTRPGTVVLSRETARGLGVVAGASFTVRAGTALRAVTAAALLEPEDERSRRALEGLLLCDIAVAQELLDMGGRLSRIDLISPGGAEPHPHSTNGWEVRVRAALPPGVSLVNAAARSRSLGGMTRAFRLNLTALGMLALLCGMFLIYNTVTFSVVQRRPLIGLLRAVGVTRGEILRLILSEAARVAVAGTALGLALGLLLGRGLLALVTRTINDLYFVVSVSDVLLSPLDLAQGAALGIGATLLAALPPALEATRVVPRAALARSVVEERARRSAPWLALGGLALLALGAALLGLAGRSLPLSFGGLFSVVVGCALIVPAAVAALSRAAARPLGALFGSIGRMAARGIGASLSRTSVAVAALMIAVSVGVAVAVMIGSFRTTVVRWLTTTLQYDVYVSAPNPVMSRSDPPLDPALVARLQAVPGQAGGSTLRAVLLEGPGGQLRLVGLRLDPRGRPAFTFKEGDPAAIWPAFDRGDAVIVSEPYAYRHDVRAGSSIRLPTKGGPRPFRVAGVFYNYGSDLGVVMLDRLAYARLWDDDAVSALGFYAAPGVAGDALVAALRRAAGGDQDVLVQSNRALRDLSLEIFDRTFTITSVLRLLVVIVAFIGVLTALLALQLERAREFGMLRAAGLTPRELWALVSAETGLMGLAAGLLAIPVGLLQAAMMIYVINRRSFGWSMPMQPEPRALVEAVAVALAAALLAGVYPAWRMSRTPPAISLREE